MLEWDYYIGYKCLSETGSRISSKDSFSDVQFKRMTISKKASKGKIKLKKKQVTTFDESVTFGAFNKITNFKHTIKNTMSVPTSQEKVPVKDVNKLLKPLVSTSHLTAIQNISFVACRLDDIFYTSSDPNVPASNGNGREQEPVRISRPVPVCNLSHMPPPISENTEDTYLVICRVPSRSSKERNCSKPDTGRINVSRCASEIRNRILSEHNPTGEGGSHQRHIFFEHQNEAQRKMEQVPIYGSARRTGLSEISDFLTVDQIDDSSDNLFNTLSSDNASSISQPYTASDVSFHSIGYRSKRSFNSFQDSHSTGSCDTYEPYECPIKKCHHWLKLNKKEIPFPMTCAKSINQVEDKSFSEHHFRGQENSEDDLANKENSFRPSLEKNKQYYHLATTKENQQTVADGGNSLCQEISDEIHTFLSNDNLDKNDTEEIWPSESEKKFPSLVSFTSSNAAKDFSSTNLEEFEEESDEECSEEHEEECSVSSPLLLDHASSSSSLEKPSKKTSTHSGAFDVQTSNQSPPKITVEKGLDEEEFVDGDEICGYETPKSCTFYPIEDDSQVAHQCECSEFYPINDEMQNNNSILNSLPTFIDDKPEVFIDPRCTPCDSRISTGSNIEDIHLTAGAKAPRIPEYFQKYTQTDEFEQASLHENESAPVFNETENLIYIEPEEITCRSPRPTSGKERDYHKENSSSINQQQYQYSMKSTEKESQKPKKNIYLNLCVEKGGIWKILDKENKLPPTNPKGKTCTCSNQKPTSSQADSECWPTFFGLPFRLNPFSPSSSTEKCSMSASPESRYSDNSSTQDEVKCFSQKIKKHYKDDSCQTVVHDKSSVGIQVDKSPEVKVKYTDECKKSTISKLPFQLIYETTTIDDSESESFKSESPCVTSHTVPKIGTPPSTQQDPIKSDLIVKDKMKESTNPSEDSFLRMLLELYCELEDESGISSASSDILSTSSFECTCKDDCFCKRGGMEHPLYSQTDLERRKKLDSEKHQIHQLMQETNLLPEQNQNDSRFTCPENITSLGLTGNINYNEGFNSLRSRSSWNGINAMLDHFNQVTPFSPDTQNQPRPKYKFSQLGNGIGNSLLGKNSVCNNCCDDCCIHVIRSGISIHLSDCNLYCKGNETSKTNHSNDDVLYYQSNEIHSHHWKNQRNVF